MQRPDVLRIPPFTVKIVDLDPTEAEKVYGVFYSEHLEIRLRPKFATRQQHAETLMHEIMHVAYFCAGLSPKDSEERIVASMSMQLCSIIQSNPELIAWVRENLAESAGSISSDTKPLKISKRAAGKQRRPSKARTTGDGRN